MNNGQFFLIYPPGLEELGKEELLYRKSLFDHWEKIEIQSIEPGGIEILAPNELILELNQSLKTPVRILYRIHSFKCTDFPKLFNKISKIPWNQYLLGVPPAINASSSQSRLFDSRKIEKAVSDGIKQFFVKQPPKKLFLDLAEKLKDQMPAVYIRFNHDLCTVSIDTSGEMLFKRKEKDLMGHAPLRENLASLLLTPILKIEDKEIQKIIDPMCGSATFLTEAQEYYDYNKDRNYSCLYIPLFKDKLIQNNQKNRKITYELIGRDIDENLVLKLKKEYVGIDFQSMDFFNDKNRIKELNSFYIVNPPYGKRVGENIDETFFAHFIDQISFISPKYFGIIIPFNLKLKKLEKYKAIGKWDFKNGGLEVSYYLFQRI